MIPRSRIISILLPSRGLETAFLNMLIGSCRNPEALGTNILLLLGNYNLLLKNKIKL